MAAVRSSAPPGVLRSLIMDPKHGPLPAVLLMLTVVTGLVDAVSLLSLGRVFVANMTGNVVFIGFALAGAPGFSLAASLAALAGFIVGAGVGGRLTSAHGEHRPTVVRIMLATELALMTGSLVATAIAGAPFANGTRDTVAAALAIALGIQNAVVRHLKVPDLTTTVLTMTLTGIAADIRTQPRGIVVRRMLAVAAMLLGAAVGALLVIHVSPSAALGVVVGVIAALLVGLTVDRRAWS